MFNETTYIEDGEELGVASRPQRIHQRRRRGSGLADDSFDLGALIERGISTAPAIISAARSPYPNYNNLPSRNGVGGVGGSGQTTIGPNGLSTSGGFSINTNTIVIVGLGLLLLWALKKGK